ncbi:MAG: MFS transporter, partial [Planctomycetota bacterium]
FAFFNIAVFYSFISFLSTLPIEKEWTGILIGLLSASALILRPIISTILTPRNAIRWLTLGIALTALSLCLYSHIQSLTLLIGLRILHGAGYVILMASSVTLLMVFMPPEKSGQGFGIITIMTLLPYAIAPFLMENYLADIKLSAIYCFTALLMFPAGILMIPLAKQVKKNLPDEATAPSRLPKGSLLENLKQGKILCLLTANGMVISVFAVIFFFMKKFTADAKIGDPGLFFTIATFAMIGVRIFLGRLFDKFNKAVLAIASLVVLAAGLFLLSSFASLNIFYAAAVVYGIGIGAVTPLMNGLMFTISKPIYRGLNTNLMLEMVDVGFFTGPVLCAFAINQGLSQTNIIWGCIGLVAVAAGLLAVIIKAKTPE